MPSVSNLFRRAGLQWRPDADSVRAPEGTLLHATNLVPDAEGSLELRRGSEIVYSDMASTVDSLYTAVLAANSEMVTPANTTVRLAGSGDIVYIDGVSKLTGVTGSGDISFGDDSRQAYIARGITNKKYDGTSILNWSVARPVGKPILAALAASTKTIAAFNNTESPAVTAVEGTATSAPDYAAAANEAILLDPDSTTNRGILQRLWTTDEDFFDIIGIDGQETDLLDFYLKIENPRHVKSIKIVFGLDDSSTLPFATDRFEFTFKLDGVPIQVKDPVSEGYAAYEESVLKSTLGILPQSITGITSPSEVKKTLAGVGGTPSPKSLEPQANTWSHLTVSRGQFDRIGNTASRGWTTVRGFRIVYTLNKGKSTNVTFSDAIFVGGGDRALTGTYRAIYQAVRQMEDDEGNVIYYQTSPPSVQSDPINLNHQSLTVTIGSTDLAQLDKQADQIWIYLFGGWLDAYYRFAVVPANPNQGMSLDELNTPAGSDFNSVVKRTRIPSWGYTYCQLNGSGVPETTVDTSINVTLRTSELDALIANDRLEPYLVIAPKNIIDIAGPYLGRMWVLTKEGYLYPSSLTSPTIFISLQLIDLTRYGRPKWLAVTGTGLFAGFEKDVVSIVGDGQESPDRARANFRAQQFSIAHPPIDSCHWREGNSIIYRAADGLVELNGSSISPLPLPGISLLWRGQTRHAIEPLNVDTGRFRCTIDNGIFYILAPSGSETSGNQIHRYSFAKSQWSPLQFNEVSAFHSIYNEPDGTLLAGDSAGRVWKLESGNTDNNVNVPLDLLTPILDGGNQLAYKDPFDYQIHFDSNGETLRADIFLDGSTTTAKNFNVSSNGPGIYRQSLHDLSTFVKAQIQIIGSTSYFALAGMDFTYRVRPQRMVNFDTGYYIGDESSDWLWMSEIELDAIMNSSSFTAYLYINDSLKYTSDAITATSGVRKVYRIPLPRGMKGERPRIVFRASDTYGEGNIGIDPYSVRVRISPSGNQEGLQYRRVWPAGEAP